MIPSDPLVVQGVVFVLAALTGVALGLAFDGYRGIRRVLRPPRTLGHLLDFVVVLLLLPVAAAGLLAANWGQVRAYPVAGLLLGGAAYLGLGSPVILPVWTATLRGMLRGGAATLALASWPIRASLSVLRRRKDPDSSGLP